MFTVSWQLFSHLHLCANVIFRLNLSKCKNTHMKSWNREHMIFWTLLKVRVKIMDLFFYPEEWRKTVDLVQEQSKCHRVNCKITVSSPSLWACFHPLSPLSVVSQSTKTVLNLNMKCWNIAFNEQDSKIIMVPTGRSSENICSRRGGAQENGKTGWNSVYHKNC
jgi:hypothetical protein